MAPGWHVVSFSDTQQGSATAGVQLSHVPLPPPSLDPGNPIQVNSRFQPEHGIGVAIAADPDPDPHLGPTVVP